jgi:hypothetical protein
MDLAVPARLYVGVLLYTHIQYGSGSAEEQKLIGTHYMGRNWVGKGNVTIYCPMRLVVGLGFDPALNQESYLEYYST